jgi:molecular chaperone DnaK
MKAAADNLSKVGGEFYAAAQKAAAAGAAGATAGSDAGPGAGAAKKTEQPADVVDADFEVVDDDKKK